MLLHSYFYIFFISLWDSFLIYAFLAKFVGKKNSGLGAGTHYMFAKTGPHATFTYAIFY